MCYNSVIIYTLNKYKDFYNDGKRIKSNKNFFN